MDETNNDVRPEIKKEIAMGSCPRITGQFLTEHYGRDVTVLGTVVMLEPKNRFVKIQMTDGHSLTAESMIPLQGIKIGEFLEIEGRLFQGPDTRTDRVLIKSLIKINRRLHTTKLDDGTELNTFDSSLYNEMVELYETHRKHLNVLDKNEHFGAHDIVDESSINCCMIDLADSVEDDDPTAGFVHHFTDPRAKVKREMKAEFTESIDGVDLMVNPTKSGTEIKQELDVEFKEPIHVFEPVASSSKRGDLRATRKQQMEVDFAAKVVIKEEMEDEFTEDLPLARPQIDNHSDGGSSIVFLQHIKRETTVTKQ